MAMAKRVFLFITVNLLIVVSITTVLNLIGLQPYLSSKGIDYLSLAGFCLIWGFGGAFISLGLSRIMAKWMMGVKVIDRTKTQAPEQQWLLSTVDSIASRAGLHSSPQVGIYESDDPNAFATGPTKSRSLVAVSTGLLRRMQRDEVEGVLAHEIAHIANGDMVTLTLVQGIVNAFVMFFARILAWAASQVVDEEKQGIVNFIAVLVFDIAFSFLGMMVVAAYSRRREYRADSGGAQLVGKPKMVHALKALQRTVYGEPEAHSSIAAFKISSGKRGGLLALISTHPPLAERIQRLELAPAFAPIRA